MRKGQATQTCKQAKKSRYDPIQHDKNAGKKQTRASATTQFTDQHTNPIYNAISQMQDYSGDYYMNPTRMQTRASVMPQFMDQSNTHRYNAAEQMHQYTPDYFTKAAARRQTRASATSQAINQENTPRYDTLTQIHQMTDQYLMTDDTSRRQEIQQINASAASQVQQYDPTTQQNGQLESNRLMQARQTRAMTTHTPQRHRYETATLMQNDNNRRQTRASAMSMLMEQQSLYDPSAQMQRLERETLMSATKNQEKQPRAQATSQLMNQQTRYAPIIQQKETDTLMSNDKNNRSQAQASNMAQLMAQTTNSTYECNATQQTRQKTAEYMTEQVSITKHSNPANYQNMMYAQNCQDTYTDTQQARNTETENMNRYPSRPRYNTRQAANNLQSSWEQSQPVARNRQRAQQMSEPAPVECTLTEQINESMTQTELSITDDEIGLIKQFRTKGVDASKINVETENGKPTIAYVDKPQEEEEKTGEGNQEEGNKEENKTKSKELYNQIVVRSNNNKQDLLNMLSTLNKKGFPMPFLGPLRPMGFPPMKFNQQPSVSCFFQNSTNNMSCNGGPSTEIPTEQQVPQWTPQECLSMSNLANIFSNIYSGRMRSNQRAIPFFPVPNNQAHPLAMQMNNNYNLPRFPNWVPNFPLTPYRLSPLESHYKPKPKIPAAKRSSAIEDPTIRKAYGHTGTFKAMKKLETSKSRCEISASIKNQK